MKKNLSVQIDQIIFWGLCTTFALTPLVFVNWFTEYFEITKVVFLLVAVIILLALWCLSWLFDGKIKLTRSPLDLSLLILLAVVGLSTYFGAFHLRFLSIIGNLPRIHGSALSWVLYALLYFIAVSNIRTKEQVKVLIYTLLGSAVLVAIFTIAAYFGVYLPFDFAKTMAFTPTGSSFATAAFLILMLPVTLLSLVNKQSENVLPRSIALFLTSLFGFTLSLIGGWTTLIAVAIILAIVFFVNRKQSARLVSYLILPVAIAIGVLVLNNVPSRGKVKNPFFDKHQHYSHELQLSLADSWKVSGSAFTDSPLLGTGPATYLFDFTTYRPVSYNKTNLWTVRFDTAHDEFLQALATMGGAGLAALAFLAFSIVVFAIKGLNKDLSREDSPLIPVLSLSAIAVVVLMLLHMSTPVVMVASVAVLATLMASYKSISGKVEELAIGIKASRIYDSSLTNGDILPVIVAGLAVIAIIGAIINGVPLVQADIHHRLALNYASTQGVRTYNELLEATRLNPKTSLYRVDFAQTNFALANLIAQQKGPSPSSPAGSLTDQDKQNIQQLLSQAIAEARNATILNPLDAQNWEVLGAIYNQVTGVAQNAVQFALDSYGHAIQRDPYNPLLRLSAGGIYYSLKNYDLAIRLFTDSVNLKDDFAAGYFNLSVALREKGDLQNAATIAQQALANLPKDSSDYKAVSNYLKDLQARIATGSANEQPVTPPAAEQNGALQQKNLPKVLNNQLDNAPQVATPPAVKK